MGRDDAARKRDKSGDVRGDEVLLKRKVMM